MFSFLVSISACPKAEQVNGAITRVSLRCVIVGGNANNGANAGVFNWNSNNGISNSNANIGCHL